MFALKKGLVGLLAALIVVCVFGLSANVSHAYASTSPHSRIPYVPAIPSGRPSPIWGTVTIPNTSGGGCIYQFGYVRLGSCISENSSRQIVPDAYISPNVSDRSYFSSCTIYVELIDDYAGVAYYKGPQSCIDPLRNNYTGHYYGQIVSAQSGHYYHTNTEADYIYHNKSYYQIQDSPEQYA